ncbi:MAG: amylo-alpha-1,6-glucosidase [Ferruginibacter sp.]
MLKKDKSVLQNFSEATQLEWLETNGLGGWSSSSIIGCNTRRYHGLLVAATVPPAERMNLVSKLDETIVVNDQRFELGTNNYGNAINPNGYNYIRLFTKDLFPEWIYEVDGIQLKKTIAMVHGENTTLIVYDVVRASKTFSLELLPLLSVKGYHSLMHANNDIDREATFNNNIFKTKTYEGTPDIFIQVPGADYKANPNWFYNFNYSVEQYRGQDFIEDLFNHGTLSVQLKKGDSIGIIISTEDPAGKDAHELLAKESLRRQLLLNDQPNDKTVQQLVLAADQFIVKRGEDLKTVIAGYHWFTDWGRDTMISLPGLCLSTGRFEDAKKILAAFAASVSQGMLPNRFQDNGEAPEYNNVDGTLWYFISIHKYLQATNDKKFVLNEILPVLKDIIDWHHKGTRYHIHDEADGLLYSGEEGVQLTWMDAKVGDWVVTPRSGKAVEIQALWYNALCIYGELLELNKEKAEATHINEKAGLVKRSFLQQFWNAENNCLYDVIDGNMKDDSIRPNQLFAISLPYPVIDGKQAKAVLKIVEEKLYTPVGLKSLPADDGRYVGIYGGDQMHRDSSYHQGTVWSWLLGAYIDAVMKVEGKRSKAKKIIDAFKYHLEEGCIGSVSEIFDADAPHHPRGCIAQAWGVAEVLRVIKEYDLSSERNKIKKIKAAMAEPA